MEINTRLIIGLGNPGKKYEKTYHNAGFLFIDYLTDSQQPNRPIAKLLKSDVFMNQSGNFVKTAFKKFSIKSGKIKPEELLIAHDDSDIELGKYKISFDRSSAGHKGVESIIKELKTKNFWRLRIGIRETSLPVGLSAKALASTKARRAKTGLPAEARRAKAGEFVLKKFNKKNFEILNKTFEEIIRKSSF